MQEDNREINMAQALEAQALAYILPPEEGGNTYSFEDREDYLRDYIMRGITHAEEFIKRAISENHVEVAASIAKINDILSGMNMLKKVQARRIQELKQFIENRPENKEVKDIIENLEDAKMQLEYHYIGDESDLGRIIFDVNNTDRYVSDWFNGIGNAEAYVHRAIREDYASLLPIIAQSKPRKADILIDLLIEHLNQVDDENAILVILGLNSIREILKANDPEAIAAALEDAASSVGLDSVLANKQIANIFSSQLLQRNALPYINSLEVLLEVCQRLGPQKYAAIEKQIFDACLNHNFGAKHDNFIKVLAELKKHGQEKTPQTGPEIKVLKEAPEMEHLSLLESKEKRQPPLWEGEEKQPHLWEAEERLPAIQRIKVGQCIKIKLDEPIRSDFYIQFANDNAEALADLAFQKNPRMFKDLLIQALEVLAKDKIMLAEKWIFLQKLFGELNTFYYFDECFIALDALKATDLTPIISRPLTSPERDDNELAETRRELEESEEFYIPNGQTSLYSSLMSTIFGNASSVTTDKPEKEKGKEKCKEKEFSAEKTNGGVERQVNSPMPVERPASRPFGFLSVPGSFWGSGQQTTPAVASQNPGDNNGMEKEPEIDSVDAPVSVMPFQGEVELQVSRSSNGETMEQVPSVKTGFNPLSYIPNLNPLGFGGFWGRKGQQTTPPVTSQNQDNDQGKDNVKVVETTYSN